MEYFVGYILPYISLTIFVLGCAFHLWRWTASNLRHYASLAPFPTSWAGTVGFIGWQIVSFWNVFKFDRVLWFGAWPMHLALAMIAGGHLLGIYTLGTQFTYLGVTAEQSVAASEFLGAFFGWVVFAGLIYLLIRRVIFPHVRAISAPSDYLHLILLITITGIGNYMRLVPAVQCTYEEARLFIGGLITFNWAPLPESAFFFWHFLAVQVLMIVFPFSKLMHSFGMLWERWIINRPFKEWPIGMPGTQKPLSRDYSGQDSGRRLVVGG